MKKLNIPTKIYSGTDSLTILDEIRDKKILLVCDSFLPGTEGLAHVLSHISDSNTVTIFSDVVPEPPLPTVMEGVKIYQTAAPSIIIAVGGGSAIDTAKGIRFFGEKVQDNRIESFIAIPTTSGTGSEVTQHAVMSDPARGEKAPILNDHLIPDIAILDAQMVVSCPKSVTAYSGLDALTHAIEALISRDATMFTDAFAEKAIDIISHHLVTVYQNPENLEERKLVHEASTCAGLAFSDAGLGICHSLAHQIGAKFHVPHGLANAMLLPYIIEFNAQDKENAQKLGQAIIKADLGTSTLSNQLLIKRLQKHIFKMMKAMDCPKTLIEFGIKETEVYENMDWIISHAKKDGTFPGNRMVPTDEELRQLIAKIIK